MKKVAIIFIILLASCLFLTISIVHATPTDKTIISSVSGTSNDLNSIAIFGNSVKEQPKITVTSGSPAYFLIDDGNGHWQKKIEGQWKNKTEGNFTSGTWRFYCQVRIDGNSAQEYQLANPISVNLNDNQLNVEETFIADDYSYAWVSFPEITIEKPDLIKGDINNDEQVTLLDVRLMLQKVINNSYTNEEINIIDYNNDDDATLLDVRLFLQHIVNGG